MPGLSMLMDFMPCIYYCRLSLAKLACNVLCIGALYRLLRKTLGLTPSGWLFSSLRQVHHPVQMQHCLSVLISGSMSRMAVPQQRHSSWMLSSTASGSPGGSESVHSDGTAQPTHQQAC